MGSNAGATAVICPISVVITVLLGFGTFGSKWINADLGGLCEQLGSRPECCVGRTLHNCNYALGLMDISSGLYGMVLVAFLMSIVVTFLFFIGGWCWCSNFRFSDFAVCGPLRCHRFLGTVGGYLLWLYPIAGVLGFAGSMLFLKDYSGAPFGYSFYLCIASSCLLLLASIVLVVYVCCRRNQYISNIRSSEYGGAGNQTSSGTECVICLQSLNVFLLTWMTMRLRNLTQQVALEYISLSNPFTLLYGIM